jgi:diamine N-acetyltransferase
MPSIGPVDLVGRLGRRSRDRLDRRVFGASAASASAYDSTLMAVVQLHDIVTAADRAAVMTLRRGPGQERYLGPMAAHFEDAVSDARACPRMWSVHDGDLLIGFAMISDGIPAERLAADDDLVGPYYLWRLLIDERFQCLGYGAATIDAVVAYLGTRPAADVLWTSCKTGPGSPQPFYLRYGFVLTGDVKWDENLLRLDLTPHPSRRA